MAAVVVSSSSVRSTPIIGEDVQGALPVFAGLFVLVESVVGVGEPVVGAGPVEGLAQLARQGERPVVVGNGYIRIAGGVP
jgi:hypothetical protein